MRTPRKGKRIRNAGIVMVLLAAIPELLQLFTPEVLSLLSAEAQHYVLIFQQVLAAIATIHIVGGQAQIEGNPDEVFKKKK